MSFVDSLPDDDKALSFLFLVKETAHSLLLILGLDLVALVLICLCILEGMTYTHGLEAGWTFLSLFGVGETKATAFLFFISFT